MDTLYPLGMTNIANWKMAIEIVDVPIEDGDGDHLRIENIISNSHEMEMTSKIRGISCSSSIGCSEIIHWMLHQSEKPIDFGGRHISQKPP